MICGGNVRSLALSALCIIGVYGPTVASGHSVYRSATSVGVRTSRSTFVLFGDTRLAPVGLRAPSSHSSAMQSGAWLHTSRWVSSGRSGRFAARFHGGIGAFATRSGHSGGVQCVTFARADSGIELEGNANAWWGHAAGLYQRGKVPEPGSVLSFQSNGAMRLGHVAVVDTVIDSRNVIIDHANWGGPGAGRGSVSRSISVVDVSSGNDWTAVRVGLGHTGDYGSIYPTNGFIYNRPDGGVMVASIATSAPVPLMNPAPRDLRGRASEGGEEEVAEAPEVDGRSYGYAGGRYSRFGHHRRLVMFRGGSPHGAFHGASLHTAAFNGRPAGHSAVHHRRG